MPAASPLGVRIVRRTLLWLIALVPALSALPVRAEQALPDSTTTASVSRIPGCFRTNTPTLPARCPAPWMPASHAHSHAGSIRRTLS